MGRAWTPAEVLPHAPPMLLLSRVVSWEPNGLISEVDITADSQFAEAGLGVPRWVGLEYMAQTVGALDGIRLREAGQAVPPGFLLGTRRLLNVDGYFQTGRTLRITVREVLQGDNGLGVFACELQEADRTLACQLTVYRPPVSGHLAGG